MTEAITGTATPGPRRGFGIDIGGSGIKGGIVDLDTGALIGDRFKLPTPSPATPTNAPPASSPAITPTPPVRGVGVTCSERSLG